MYEDDDDARIEGGQELGALATGEWGEEGVPRKKNKK